MKYFGTDGIRGIYGSELSEELAYKAGLAASRYFGDCVVGRDTRQSGEQLTDSLTRGLVAGGCKVLDMGIVPTPAISYLAGKYSAGGIMVSASHNPPEYNGLKFFSQSGYKLTLYLESGIEEGIDRPPARVGGGSVIHCDSGKQEYIDFLVKNGGDLRGRSVTLDCAFGAASSVAEEVFTRTGAKVTMLSDQKDGSRINCGVGALYPQFVSKHTSGLGFAFDGDADRLAVTDGGIVDGDSVLYNLALMLSPVGVAGTVLTNLALERALEEKGITFVRTPVGDKYISDAMRRMGLTLGGEQSGHYIISPSRSGDALFAALMLSRLSEFKRLRLVPQRAVSLPATNDILYDKKFLAAKDECESRLRGKGRMVARMSGTEPKIRIMVESEDEKLLDEILDIITQSIVNKEKNKQ